MEPISHMLSLLGFLVLFPVAVGVLRGVRRAILHVVRGGDAGPWIGECDRARGIYLFT